MEIKQAVEQIIKENKWYAVSEDEKTQIWLMTTAPRILKGTSKKETIEKFLKHFGYEIKTNVTKIK